MIHVPFPVTFGVLLFISLMAFHYRAFSMQFLMDDFFFIHITQISSIQEFFQFFNPFRDYFYRPVSTELFYFLIKLSGYNLFFAHTMVFAVFCTGLVFMYKSIVHISNRPVFAALGVLLYTFHLSHVFQLYWLATAQEVFLFTFVSLSFFYYLSKKYVLSVIWFLCALLSKETALLYPVALAIYEAARFNWYYWQTKDLRSLLQSINIQTIIRSIPHTMFFTNIGTGITHRRPLSLRKTGNNEYTNVKIIISFSILSVLFFLIHRYAISNVETIDIYQVQWWNIRMILNNLFWYAMWSLGFPNYMPDYMVSIFGPLLPDFWKSLSTWESRWYFYPLLIFQAGFILLAILLTIRDNVYRKYLFYLTPILGILFVLFISPTLPIIHRWMVRLTLPTIFISIFTALIIYAAFQKKGILRILSFILIVLYGITHYFGTGVHYHFSTYALSNRIVSHADRVFSERGEHISRFENLYILDEPNVINKSWGGYEKLKVALHNEHFADYFLPNSQINVFYGGHTTKVAPNSYVIRSSELFNDSVMHYNDFNK